VLVDSDAHKAAFDGVIARTLDNPRWHAYVTFIFSTLQAHYRWGRRGKVDFIFDKMSGTELNELRSYWEAMKISLPMPWLIRRMGRKPVDDDDEAILPLQAADLLASTIGRCMADESGNVSPKQSLAASWLLELTSRMPFSYTLWRPEMLQVLGARMSEQKQLLGYDYESGKARSNRLTCFLTAAKPS